LYTQAGSPRAIGAAADSTVRAGVALMEALPGRDLNENTILAHKII
jgi:hypothetical protein